MRVCWELWPQGLKRPFQCSSLAAFKNASEYRAPVVTPDGIKHKHQDPINIESVYRLENRECSILQEVKDSRGFLFFPPLEQNPKGLWKKCSWNALTFQKMTTNRLQFTTKFRCHTVASLCARLHTCFSPPLLCSKVGWTTHTYYLDDSQPHNTQFCVPHSCM